MRKRLIKNIDWVVTVDEDRRMIADGAIAINGDRIEAVEKSSTLENAFAADEIINGRGLIAIPGLIDTNVATVQQLGRGAADLCDIPKFLLERVFAYEAVLSLRRREGGNLCLPARDDPIRHYLLCGFRQPIP